MREMPADFYALMGVTPDATQEDIRLAYEALTHQMSHDSYPGAAGAEWFRVVSEAYRVLSSNTLRAEYDAQRRLATGGPTQRHEAGRAAALTGAPAPGAWMMDGAAPLGLGVTLGGAVSAPLEEPERFYLLAELGPTSAPVAPPSARLNLALMTPRSIALWDPDLVETRRALRALTARLRPDDWLTLVAFDEQADVLLDGESVATRAGIENVLDGMAPHGSTWLSPALGLTLERLATRIEPSNVSALALIMDEASSGDDPRLLELAEQARQLGVAIVALGMGLDWDRDLLDHLASVTGGTCAFVDDPRYLTPALTDLVERLRASMASRLRLTLEPAPGVSVLRAAQIAPELASVFEGPHTPGAPVTVELGALAGEPEALSAVALWETLLEPSALSVGADGQIDVGVIHSSYWAPWQQGGRMIRAHANIHAPRRSIREQPAQAPDVLLAMELLTAHRLQARADRLSSMGDLEEACAALDMSALRLTSAGASHLADDARQASQALFNGPEHGPLEALHVRYSVRNQSPFHHLRRALAKPGG